MLLQQRQQRNGELLLHPRGLQMMVLALSKAYQQGPEHTLTLEDQYQMCQIHLKGRHEYILILTFILEYNSMSTIYRTLFDHY